jgi:anti-sigma factor RsiW
LQAYLDDALPAQERAAVTEHLSTCSRCQEEVAHLRRQGARMAEQLRVLDPQPEQEPKTQQALVRFWQQVRPERRTAPRTAWAARWRPVAIGLAVLVLIGVAISFAPVRHAAAEFLGIFRVRKFAVIPVDPARLEQLAGLQDLAQEMIGEMTTLREAGPAQQVADAAAAASLAGFPVCTPTYLPDGMTRQSFTVEAGPAMRMEVKRAQAEALLQAAGVEGVSLPDADTFTVDVDVAPVVAQSYQAGDGMVILLQTPSPEVALPPGIEPEQMGEALLQFLGMPAEDAARVAREIDWTSTLVIPLPTNVAEFREVTVGGVTGLLLVASGTTSSAEPDNLVLWHRDGLIYVVAGNNVAAEQLLQVADSLR